MIAELELAVLCLLAGLPALKQVRKPRENKSVAAQSLEVRPSERSSFALAPDWWEQPAPTFQAPAATHEIVKRVGDQWSHVGMRHANHPDLHEAMETPGLAVRHADGSIHEGKQ